MTTMQRAVLAGLAFALVFVSACHHERGRRSGGGPGVGFGKGPGHGNHYGQQKDRPFEVSIYTYTDANGSHCQADWPVAALWKTYNQTVIWISDDDKQYTIDFSAGKRKESPFQNHQLKVPVKDSTPSGALDSDPKADGYYDFAILDSKGNICKDAADPGYYVHP
jgi:hypothetical protein